MITVDPNYIYVAQVSPLRDIKKIITYIALYGICALISFILQIPLLNMASLILFLILIIVNVANSTSCKFFFYTDKVIIINGIFTQQYTEVLLIKVTSIHYQQTLLGQILNFGDVYINQLGGDNFTCTCISNPKALVTKMSPFVTQKGNHIF